MNFSQLNNLSFLQTLSEDKNSLQQTIKDTQGFVLSMMENHGIFPLIDMLLEDVNIYALSFILKNYELENSQKRKLSKYFEYNAANQVKNIKISQNEIIEYIENKEVLPNGTIIPVEILNEYAQQIIENIRFFKYPLSNHLAPLQNILQQSIQHLEIEQVLTLDKELLKYITNALKEQKKWFSDSRFKQLYKEAFFAHCQQVQATPDIYDFENYHFDASDKELLTTLLMADRSLYNTNYNDLKNIVGFSQLLSPIEYITQYNHRSLKVLSFKDTQKNSNIIKKSWVNNFNGNNFSSFTELLNYECSLQQFTCIVDKDFFGKILSKAVRLPNDSMYIYDDRNFEKSMYFKKLIVDYTLENANNKEIFKKITYNDLLANINDLDDKSHRMEFITNYLDGIYKKTYLQIAPELLKSSYNDWVDDKYNSCFLTEQSVNYVQQLSNEYPSINLLYMIIKKYNIATSYDEVYEQEDFLNALKSIINTLIPKLDENSVKIITNHLRYEVPSNIVYEDSAPKDYENNFLNYHGQDLNNINQFVFTTLIEIDRNFAIQILDKNYPLSVEHIKTIISFKDIKENLKQYIRNNAHYIITNTKIMNFINEYPELKNKLNIVHNNSVLERNYNIIINNSILIKKLNEDFINIDETKNSIEELKKEISILKKDMPYDFVNKKALETLENRDFKSFLTTSYYISNTINKHFINYVNQCDFNTLLKNVEDKTFMQLIKNSIGYGAATEININLPEKENMIIAKLMWEDFQNESTPIKILYIFAKENTKFFKDFVVEYLPEDVFYSPVLLPSPTSLINTKFTTKQILKAYVNTEKGKGFLTSDKNNSLQFFNTHLNNQTKFLNFLKKAEAHPKLYVALCNKNILENIIEPNGTSRNKQVAEFMHKHFNLDIIIQGCEQVIDDINDKNRKSTLNKVSALSLLEYVIAQSYYEIKDENYKVIDVATFWNNEQSDKLIKLIVNKAPLFLIQFNTIGTRTDINNFVNIHFSHYVEDKMIDKIVHASSSYLHNFNHQHEIETKIKSMMHSMVDCLMYNNNKNDIQYLSHLLQQYNFINNNIEKSIIPNSPYVLAVVAKDDLLFKKLDVAELKIDLENSLAVHQKVIKRSNKI